MPQEQASQHQPVTVRESFPALEVLAGLAICISTWLFFGAFGHSEWAVASGEPWTMGYDGTFWINCFLHYIGLIFLFGFLLEARPDLGGGFLVAWLTGLGASSACAALFGAGTNAFQMVFRALAGAYLGMLAEYLTAGCQRMLLHMKAIPVAYSEPKDVGKKAT